MAGVRTRPFPLLIAPSGTGKTSLVQYVSAAANLPVFSINVANWIIRGARSEQHTLTQIAQFIQSNATGVIFLDEVNKLSRQHAADSSWCSDLLSELIAFLDADSRLKAMGIGDAVEHLRRNFFIIGAAAFQDEWEQSRSSNSIGFLNDERGNEGGQFENLVRSQNTVPVELLNRFNDRIVFIQPPSVPEYVARISEIRAKLGLPSLGEAEILNLARNAFESGKAMRWLEGYAVACLKEKPDGLKRGAALPENADCATESVTREPDVARDAQNAESKRAAAYIEAYNDYLRALVSLARNAGRLEFAFAELWHIAANSTPRNEEVIQLLEHATAVLRERNRHDGANLVVYLRWISKNALSIQAASNDADRAKIANKLLNISTAMEESLSAFRSRLHVGVVSGTTRITLVEFVLSTREARNAYERLSALIP